MALALSLGFTTPSLAEDFRIDRSTYRVDLSGTYTKTWHGQTKGYPDAVTPWSFETGRTTSKWGFPGKGIKFAGSEFIGDLPGTTPLPKFQFMPLRPTIAKAKNKHHFDRKINFVPNCGGELGECDGTEKSGVEAKSKSCSANGRIPIDFKFDQNGRKPMVRIEFGSHNSMADFCGKKFPDDDVSIDQGLKLRWPDGLDRITELKVGKWLEQKAKTEKGWIGGDGHPKGARFVKTCPKMSGTGTHYCWINEYEFKITRIK